MNSKQEKWGSSSCSVFCSTVCFSAFGFVIVIEEGLPFSGPVAPCVEKKKHLSAALVRCVHIFTLSHYGRKEKTNALQLRLSQI